MHMRTIGLLCLVLLLGCSNASWKEAATSVSLKNSDSSDRESSPPMPSLPSKEEGNSHPGEKKETPREVSVPKSTLKAGSHNDNEQFARYLEYLERPFVAGMKVPKFAVEERYIIQVKDVAGNPVPNCALAVYDASSQRGIQGFTTSSSGEAIFFLNASEEAESIGEELEVQGLYEGKNFKHIFRRGAERVVVISLPFPRQIPQILPLDVVFMLDTTGSMGDEIQQLKDTLYSIHHRITTKMRIQTKIRFGMVLYRDKGDDYITKIVPLTEDIEDFQQDLDKVEADEGGDYPEELNQAFYETVTKIKWNPNGLRLVFIVTDAPPHIESFQPHDYPWTMKEAAKRGIKVYTVGASGLNDMGEYVLRQIALFTQAQYLFLTYGEKGESSDSPEAKVSHHTGANYEVGTLDDLVVRMIKKDLSYLVDASLVMEEEIPEPLEWNAFSLNQRVTNLTEQLHRQMEERIKQNPSIAVLPWMSDNPRRLSKIERFIQDALSQDLKKQDWKLLEREEVKKAFVERMVHHGSVLDDQALSEITQIQGADIFLSGRLYQMGESVVLFAKLVDVKTLEKLAVARVLWNPE